MAKNVFFFFSKVPTVTNAYYAYTMILFPILQIPFPALNIYVNFSIMFIYHIYGLFS
jgi:hypothetical protein